MHYCVKNWSDFQHYKDRSPSWLKLHKSLLDNYEFQCLPVASRALAPMLWLLASEHKDPLSGIIDADHKKIAFRLRMSVKEVDAAIEPLISGCFIEVYEGASKLLADLKQNSIPEKEEYREENKKETSEEKENTARTSSEKVLKNGKHELPEDFLPNAEAAKLCTDLGVDCSSILAEVRDWAKSKRPKYNDWQATFRNCIRRTAKSGSHKQRSPINGKPTYGDNLSGAATAAVDHIRRQESLRTEEVF